MYLFISISIIIMIMCICVYIYIYIYIYMSLGQRPDGPHRHPPLEGHDHEAEARQGPQGPAGPQGRQEEGLYYTITITYYSIL